MLTALILIQVLPSYQSTLQENAMIIKDPDIESGQFQDFAQQSPQLTVTTTDTVVSEPLRELSPVILPVTWGAVAATLIWRGKIRSQWRRQGYDYDIFRLVARMRGSATRISLLNAIIEVPKNKLQLAKELGVDWKTVDNHVEMLLKNGLVEEKMSIGTSRYYGATKDAGRVLSLLSNPDQSGPASNVAPDASFYPDQKK